MSCVFLEKRLDKPYLLEIWVRGSYRVFFWLCEKLEHLPQYRIKDWQVKQLQRWRDWCRGIFYDPFPPLPIVMDSKQQDIGQLWTDIQCKLVFWGLHEENVNQSQLFGTIYLKSLRKPSWVLGKTCSFAQKNSQWQSNVDMIKIATYVFIQVMFTYGYNNN